MLYKIIKNGKKFVDLEPLGFEDFCDHGNLEKDLECLLADNLLGVLFEDNRLMPIFQERPRQGEADIYALNENGELIIFELKRSIAGKGAVHQLLRYCEESAFWKYSDLQKKFSKYSNGDHEELREAHKENFDLNMPLEKFEFNQRQHLIIVGNSANNSLINSIEYWKKCGLSLDFMPYRVYRFGKEFLFEFFSAPYDKHMNPKKTKGVLFDTNKKYDPDAVWYMLNNNRVAAFGKQKKSINHIKIKDIVFLYHSGYGIVAAGEVTSPVKTDGDETLYRDIKLLTTKPTKDNLRQLSFKPSEIKETLGKNFFWARTIKTPHISEDEERQKLLNAIKNNQNKFLNTNK